MQAYSGRVIVKFVAIKTRKLCPNFDDSWDIGMGRGMAKKVVEVRNTDLFNPKLIKPKHANFHRESPLSPPRAGQGPRRELSQGQPNPVPAIEPLRQRSPSPLQKGSGMDLDSAKEALERAQELYNTVKSMNSSLRDEIARKGSSPRAMDRKLATENAISRSIVDDLASVETTPLSPQMHRMGKDAFALTPSVGDIRPNAGSPSVPSNTAGFILSDIPPISPRPPRPNKADVAGTIFSFGSLELAAGRNPVEPLASSPSGDMRAHRRHSPISKGGIAPGFGLPTGGLDHHIALPEHRTGIGITIPSDKEAEEDYDDDVFGSDTDWGQGDLTYSKSNINESDVEHKSVFTANRLRSVSGSDEERAAIYQKGNSQSSHIIVDHDSAASENCNSEDEENEKASRLREIDKYAKLEKTALGCSEWRGVLVDTRLSTDFSRLLKDVTSPILPHSGKKFDNQKITVNSCHFSNVYNLY